MSSFRHIKTFAMVVIIMMSSCMISQNSSCRTSHVVFPAYENIRVERRNYDVIGARKRVSLHNSMRSLSPDQLSLSSSLAPQSQALTSNSNVLRALRKPAPTGGASRNTSLTT